MIKMIPKKMSTIQVDKSTQKLVREYCFIHQINMRDFVGEILKEKLEDFRKGIEELKKIRP